ncbi:MAG: GntR family transcriptional regulator [Clostridia bacterium]|nr:GntR family transcriptional regulator [Clostridia bacterium]
MLISLDYQSRTPIYEQIVLEIERYVALGILKTEDQLPSIRELATELGINPNTVKKAYSILESKGAIVTLSTKGTFISIHTKKVIQEKIESKISEIKNIIGELEKLGLTKEEIIKRI